MYITFMVTYSLWIMITAQDSGKVSWTPYHKLDTLHTKSDSVYCIALASLFGSIFIWLYYSRLNSMLMSLCWFNCTLLIVFTRTIYDFYSFYILAMAFSCKVYCSCGRPWMVDEQIFYALHVQEHLVTWCFFQFFVVLMETKSMVEI